MIFLVVLTLTSIYCIHSITKIKYKIYSAEQKDTYNYSTHNKTPEKVKDIIYNCANKEGLKDNMECFTSEIKNFFIYNKTDDNIELNFTQLIERGGDCRNWAQFYKSLSIAKGYNVDLIRLKINSTNSHIFAVASNEEGYCIADQKSLFCFIYK